MMNPTYMGYREADVRQAVRAAGTALEQAIALPSAAARYERIDELWRQGRALDRLALRELMIARLAGYVVPAGEETDDGRP